MAIAAGKSVLGPRIKLLSNNFKLIKYFYFILKDFVSHIEIVFPRELIRQVLCSFTRNMQIAQALQMQMEVQRKLYEQIEVAH